MGCQVHSSKLHVIVFCITVEEKQKYARAVNGSEGTVSEKIESFSDQFGDRGLVRGMFNFYPRCSRPDLVLGVKPRTDRSGITVLPQDREVEGLQIMSDGMFRSPLLQVVTNSELYKLYLEISFNNLNPEKDIGPVDCLVDEQRPRLYRNVKNYSLIYYEWHQKGNVAIDTLKISSWCTLCCFLFS
ncbi:hypothetical protein BDE02_06G053200 [Populus trichocarpa]|nr:hypothetical protein BDE02_06G053200 [Populus trichocarpa]